MKKISPYIIVGILLIAFIFFRFYQLEERATVGWDQMDNAWAAVRIVHNHTYPLVGMMARLNSGIVIGPLYYYLVALFYMMTRYDPIASPLLAGCTSIIAFFTLYLVAKRLHGLTVAYISLLIYTFSFLFITIDRVQWPVNFIPILSLIIFYALYNVCRGKPRQFLLLGGAVGVSFHIHFTSVFYLPIIIAAIPFIPKNKSMLYYGLAALGIFLAFQIPQFVYEAARIHQSGGDSTLRYLTVYNHGFHLRRFMQLDHDAFIEFERALSFSFLRPFVFVVPVAYTLMLRWQHSDRQRIVLPYLLLLWILVPWIAFTVYSGEISAYYFSLTQPIAIIVVAYLLGAVWSWNKLPVRVLLFVILIYYATVNTQTFFRSGGNNELAKAREEAKKHIFLDNPIPFKDGDVPSYLYYMYTTLQKSANNKRGL